MKRLFKIFIVSLIALALVACNYNEFVATNKISSPKIEPSILGKWKIETYKYLNTDAPEDASIKLWVNKMITLKKDTIVSPNDTFINPKYKLKVVNSLEYIYNKYNTIPENLGIEENEIQVFTIACSNNYFINIILLNNDEAILEKNSTLYYLSRIGSEDKGIVNNHEFNRGVTVKPSEVITANKFKRYQSGVIIGLKSYVEEEYNYPYGNKEEKAKTPVYRTLWISYDGKVKEIKELPYILLVRKNGFWKVDSKRIKGDNYFYDSISAAPIGKTSKTKTPSQDFINNSSFYTEKSINFISNDYISLDVKGEGNNKEEAQPYQYSLLNTIPIDTIYSGEDRAITISEAIGDKGVDALKVAIQGSAKNKESNKNFQLKDAEQFNSFGLVRKNGKWVMKGRVNFSNDNLSYNYGDFEIPILMPESLLKYDSIFAPWSQVKQSIPQAKDIFSSPNKNMSIVVTDESLLVYPIAENSLGETPAKEIKLKENETVIMAEWATGEYVDIWADQVDKSVSLEKKAEEQKTEK